ncbi:hypothetical protein DGWBC_1078 [Dehalogenimonas sp. WBC-2]|nr:hypothetical protein DGWBC_1078 [Dehalogenimonas sp. WBC-2]
MATDIIRTPALAFIHHPIQVKYPERYQLSQLTDIRPDPLKFRLSFIILPLIITLLTAILSVIFFNRLPEAVYYRFDTGGVPSGNAVTKGTFLIMMVGIQGILLAVAYFATASISRVQTFRDNVGNFWFNPTRLLTLMGNMPAIIQFIIGYVLIDAIVYALQSDHLMPLWLFAVITLVIGAILILIFGLPIIIQAYKGFSNIQEKKKE